MKGIAEPFVPTSWSWRPLDSIATVSVSSVDKKSHEGEVPIKLCNYTDVYYNKHITKNIEFMQATASVDQIQRFAVTAGDVVITKDSESSGDVGRPAYVPLSLPGVVYGYHLAIYRPFDERFGKFLAYLFDSSWVRAQFEVRTPGVTRIGLSQNTLRHLRVPVPEPESAAKIANYLDHETAEIDAFVADQLLLIEGLKERWNATIVSTVQPQLLLRGDRGEGSAPVGLKSPWTEGRLKTTIDSSTNGAWGEDHDQTGVVRRCIRVADFDKAQGLIHDRNITCRSYPAWQTESLALQENDLLIEKSGGGPGSPVGNVVLYDGKGGDMYSNFVARIRLRKGMDPLFALYLHKALYLSGVTQRSIKQTTGIQNLDSASYFNERVWIPPVEEQIDLGTMLHHRRGVLETAIRTVEESIELSRERRAALISAAVTGQIDVTAKHTPVAEQLEAELAEAR